MSERSLAKQYNQKFYFTGRPCKYGHVAKRYVGDGKCTICSKIHSKQWAEENPEKINDANRKHYNSNKDWHNRRCTDWKKANWDRVIAYAKVQSKNRRAKTKQAIPTWFGELDELVLYEMDQHKQDMRVLGIELHIDHIVPLTNPQVCGLHCKDNWQLLEAKQNLAKGNKHKF